MDPIHRKIFSMCQLVFHMTSEFSFKWQPHSLVEQLTGKANILSIMMPPATGLTLYLWLLPPTTTDKPNNGCQLAGNSAHHHLSEIFILPIYKAFHLTLSFDVPIFKTCTQVCICKQIKLCSASFTICFCLQDYTTCSCWSI